MAGTPEALLTPTPNPNPNPTPIPTPGSPEAVMTFMGKVSDLAKAGADKDLAALRAAKVAHLDGRGEIRGGGHGRAACRIEVSSRQ